jgi:hypothetical protein
MNGQCRRRGKGAAYKLGGVLSKQPWISVRTAGEEM